MDIDKLVAKGKPLASETDKSAKMSVLKDLRDKASASLGEKLKGLRKKAGVEEKSSEPVQEVNFSSEADMSEEEIDAKIKKLLELKDKLKK